MSLQIFNILLTAGVIGFTAYLSATQPRLAGFIVALPLATLLVLPLSYLQSHDSVNTLRFAKSILVAIPVSLMFFVPFFFSEKWKLTFWQTYLLGLACLVMGYFLHKILFERLT